ncbi:MAG: hypothetical protein ACRDM2_00800 [Gaiellaceae bacterium]
MSTAALVHPFRRNRRPRVRLFNAYLLNATFESPEGDHRSALGGGESIAEAIAAARGELPLGVEWTLARWSHVFGE